MNRMNWQQNHDDLFDAWVLINESYARSNVTNITNTTEKGEIRGMILDQITQAPIEDVIVSIINKDLQTTTNNQGAYMIEEILPGEATILVEASGYLSQTREVTITGNSTITLDFILMPEPAYGAIEGVVFDSKTGDPIANAQIFIAGDTIPLISSNNQGVFIVDNLTAGEYEITVKAYGYQSETKSVTVTPNATVSVDIALKLDMISDPVFVEHFFCLHRDLGFPVVVSILDPVLPDVPFSVESGIHNGSAILTSSSESIASDFDMDYLTLEQEDVIHHFDSITFITQARYLTHNDNRLLFSGKNLNYDSPFLTQINADYPDFKYTETRITLGGKTSIRPVMEVKANQEITFQSGTYFFESLTLDEGAVIRTNGDVKILTTALTLRAGASLIGSDCGENPIAQKLIILAEYWPGYPYNSEVNRVSIGPGAQVVGHIVAPRIRVMIDPGCINQETRIEGSILTKQLIVNQEIYCPGQPGRVIIIGSPIPPGPFPDEDIYQVLSSLDFPVVVSFLDVMLGNESLFIEAGCFNGSKLLTSSPDNPIIFPFDIDDLIPEQRIVIDNFDIIHRISHARYLLNNDNRLVFTGKNLNYDSPWLTRINVDYPDFKYTDTRKTLSGKVLIQPTMKVKANQEIIFQSGTYFFESLTLNEGAEIRTNGDVKIYTTALTLKEGACLIGSDCGENPKAQNLIILAEYWPGYPYSNEVNRVRIGSGARVVGHIIAPRIRVMAGSGCMSQETRIIGSILTKQLILLYQAMNCSDEPACVRIIGSPVMN